jgi:hypothetical protein
MPPITPPAPQDSALLLQTLKAAIAAAKAEQALLPPLIRHTAKLVAENTALETEVDQAYNQAFLVFVEQLREAELTHADAYVTTLEGAIEALSGDKKKAEQP